MKLPKNYFESLSTSKYREYLKLLPSMKKENTKAITMIIFTFVGLSFLGIFAINPTLTTIVELNKQLEDSEFVHQQLTTKMNNLSSLQQQYTLLENDLPFIYAAIPQNANAPTLVGQIAALAENHTIKINSLQVSEVTLSPTKLSQQKGESFTFTLDAEGEYDNMMEFAAALANFKRIVTIESIGLTKDQRRDVIVLTIKGKEYFKN